MRRPSDRKVESSCGLTLTLQREMYIDQPAFKSFPCFARNSHGQCCSLESDAFTAKLVRFSAGFAEHVVIDKLDWELVCDGSDEALRVTAIAFTWNVPSDGGVLDAVVDESCDGSCELLDLLEAENKTAKAAAKASAKTKAKPRPKPEASASPADDFWDTMG